METVKDNLTIRTPEQIGFNYKISGLGSRSIAFILDYTIRGILIFFIFVLFYLLYQIFPAAFSFIIKVDFPKTWLMALGFLFYALLYLGYFLIFEALWIGQTPGKRIMDLRVVRIDGQPIGWLESAIRNIIRALDMLAGFYPVGLIVMFLSSNARRIGDYAAGTIVIVERGVKVPDSQPRSASPTRPYTADIEINISTITPKEYQVMKSFLQRRQDMDRLHSNQIARTLTLRLKEKWGLSMRDISYESFIEEVVRVYEHKKRAI
jgi:uncharacterized RDD family membrane protein YckC